MLSIMEEIDDDERERERERELIRKMITALWNCLCLSVSIVKINIIKCILL